MKDWTKFQDFEFECFKGELKGHVMYALDLNANILWKVDLLARAATVEAWINDDGLGTADYFSICITNDELVLMPKDNGNFAIYDINKKVFSYVSGEKTELRSPNHLDLPPYFESVAYGTDAYIFGAGDKSIIRLESKDGAPIISEIWSSKDYNGSINDNALLFFSHGKLVEVPYIYVTGGKYCAVFRIDTQVNKCDCFPLESNIKVVHGIIKHQGAKWLLVNINGELCFIKWDEKENQKEKIAIGYEKQGTIWWNPIVLNDYYYIFPTNGTHVYRVNIENGEAILIESISRILEDLPDQDGKYAIRIMGQYDGKLLFFTNWNHKWHEYNVTTDSIESFYIKVEDQDYKQCYWKTWRDGITENGGIVREADMQLVRFIEMIADGNT